MCAKLNSQEGAGHVMAENGIPNRGDIASPRALMKIWARAI